LSKEKQEYDGPRTNREDAQLWRWLLFFMVLLAVAFAALAWEHLESLPFSLRSAPVGVVVLAVLLAAYAYDRKREVSALHSILHDLRERAVTPSDEQLDQLGQMIARSQRSFKELIDSFEDAAFAISLDGTVRTVNRKVTEWVGVNYTDIVGHQIFDFIDEPSRDVLVSKLNQFLGRRHWTGVVTFRLKGQSRLLYFDCVVNAIVKGLDVTGISILARDVTAQHEKELRFTEFVETLQEGVYFSSPDGKFFDVNSALAGMLGYSSKQDLLAQPTEAIRAEGPALERSLNDGGATLSREVHLRRRDGSVGTFLDSSRAVRDAAGSLVRYEGTLVDVTEKKALERQIAEEEEFRQHLLESFPDLILVADLTGKLTFVSSRISAILGYTAQDFLGREISNPVTESPELTALFRDVASGNAQIATADFSARHRDGTRRNLRASAAPMFGGDSKVRAVVVSLHDLTLEKKMEHQLIQSERLAAMGAMIGGIAHELNNPLTSILGMSELLQDSQSTDTARKHLSLLQQQARRAAEIVQNLTYFSRSGGVGSNRVNVADTVERTLSLHAYSLRRSNITVDFLREASMPAVVVEPNRLMQVFLNLILNAEQAIREVRERGTLRIRTGFTADSVWVTFQDDGPGIPSEILPSIFDPFYTTKRPGRGTGLGLSICKSVITEHKGTLEAENAPGGGAVFTVTLPIAAAASATTA
jgi:PAS domain S-box-containing protein